MTVAQSASHPASSIGKLANTEREIQFLNRTETNYPNLTRLSLDFGFRVLETLKLGGDQPKRSFVLVTDDYRCSHGDAITPQFDSLKALDNHIADKVVDILHDYLFGFVEDDIEMASAALS